MLSNRQTIFFRNPTPTITPCLHIIYSYSTSSYLPLSSSFIHSPLYFIAFHLFLSICPFYALSSLSIVSFLSILFSIPLHNVCPLLFIFPISLYSPITLFIHSSFILSYSLLLSLTHLNFHSYPQSYPQSC